MAKTDEIALDVEGDGESRLLVVFGDFGDVVGKALLTIEDAFFFATGVRIDAKTAVPPFGTHVKEKMMNDAVSKWGSNDFTGNRVMDDKSNATVGLIATTEDAVAQENNIFHIVELKTVFVDGFAFAFAGGLIGAPELIE